MEKQMIEDFRKTVSKLRPQYEEWMKSNSKLAFVKELKNNTLDGFGNPKYGLKEAKDFADMVFANQISITTIVEDRKKKLERLAKTPLIELILEKIKNFSDDEMKSLLFNLDTDVLLTIDEILDKKISNYILDNE